MHLISRLWLKSMVYLMIWFSFLRIFFPMLYKTLSYFLVWPNQICFGTTRHPSLWQHNRHQREQKKSRTPFFAQCALQKISKTRCKKVMSFSVSLCLNYSRSKNRKKPLGMCKITGLWNHSLYWWTYLPNYFHFLANFEHSLWCKIPKWQLWWVLL